MDCDIGFLVIQESRDILVGVVYATVEVVLLEAWGSYS